MSNEKPGEVVIISREYAEKALTYREVLDICDNVFKWAGDERIKQTKLGPFMIAPFDVPTGRSFSSFIAYIEPLHIGGTKWLSRVRANPEKGLPYIPATIILNDGETMLPIAVIDGVGITSMRTAGHAGVGATYLAKKDSSVVAIVGCGLEGKTHLMMMDEIFKIKEVRIFDIRNEVMKNFATEMSQRLGIGIKTFANPKETVKNADVICMVTTANQPILQEQWVEPGCHVVGTAQFRDLDPTLSGAVDKWVLGNWELDAEWMAGPGHWAGKLSKEDVYADLSEIATGKKPGRESDQERTLMTHGGMAALDIATAYAVYKVAKKRGDVPKATLFSS